MRKFLSLVINVILLVQSVVPYGTALAQEATPSASVESIQNQPAATSSASPSATFIHSLPVDQIATSSSQPVASVSSFIDELFWPTPTIVQKSAGIRQQARVHKIGKSHFTARESIVFTIESDTPDEITIESTGPKGKVILPVKRAVIAGGVELTIARPADFVPGKYTITVTDSLGTQTTQDFFWGVLAINTNKSVYTPGEQANIAIAVLDELGRMVCDAKVTLDIGHPSGQKTTLTTENGSIIVNEACKKREVTNQPDYETHAPVSEEGTHTLTLAAVTKNGTHTITDMFKVTKDVPFSVERITATRIYPQNTYPVRLAITANVDFSGTITESVPEKFMITPLESVASYSAVRVGYRPDQRDNQSTISLRYPFEGEYAQTLGFGRDVEDPKLKEQYQTFGLNGHDGIDFALPAGTRVVAADSGLVSLAGNGVYGTTVVIQHPWGRSYYGHLDGVTVAKGERVQRGQQIGLSGQTGLTTGAHLHFGIRPRQKDMTNGYYGKIDPMPYLGNPPPESESQHTLISWNVSLKKGESIALGYQYKAPMISPQLYVAGPLQFRQSAAVLGEMVGTQPATPLADVLFDSEEASFDSLKDRLIPLDAGQIVFEEARQWQIAADATFSMQTGYYVGTGTDNFAITGVGFQPNLVLIKDDTANGADGVAFKTSAMSGETSSVLGDPDADTASNAIQSLDSNGFTLGTDADVNTANIRFTWIAFSGSDCTSSGTFCVGSYTGDGAASHAITSVGFQPNFVAVKRSGATNGVFRTSSMATNVGQSIAAANEDTTGVIFQTLDATGFTVGSDASVNTSANTYWYFAFKTTASALAVGTFTGDGLDNKSITVGFAPDYVWIKNSNATTAVTAHYNVTESNNDFSSTFTDAANATGVIKSLDSNGFTVGTNVAGNENTKTIYWVAFGGAVDPTASGTYTMKVGSYTGNGTSQSITGVGFAPDLVIIKKSTEATQSAFRTTLMKGDTTAYMADAVTEFAGGITSLDSDGFSVGADITVNVSAATYHYQAFGNAFNPEDNTGAADFSIGAYTGNALDNRNIRRNPFQPDLVMIKRTGSWRPRWRTSNQSGDLSFTLQSDAEAADAIQGFNSEGFQVGTTGVNGSAAIHRFFAFKTGTNMVVGNYSGTGSAQNITSVGFQPDLVWVKGAGTTYGVQRSSVISGDSTLYFIDNAPVSDRITGMLSNGFSIGGNQTETNTSAANYHYATWKVPVSGPTLDQLLRHGAWFSSGVEQSFTF